MSNYGRNSELAKFIIEQSDSYNAISEAVKSYAIRNRRELDFLDDPNTFIEFDDISFKYALNVTIDGDVIEFDAVVEGSFTWQTRQSRRHDFNDEIGYQWFGLHCVMSITDKLESFNVTRIERYSNEQKKNVQNPATADFVPVIHKKDFDDEAIKFLEKWCPQALKEPMRLPIREIAEQYMGLKVITDTHLTRDHSVFGQICFADGEISTYDETQDKYVKTHVERGTVFIDPNTYFLRCLGCVHNTIAHEAFHWERHRIYATIKSILSKKQTVAQRCPTTPKGNIVRDTLTSSEDWMEWQANGIAPKILMPKIPTMHKIKEIAAVQGYIDSDEPDHDKLTAIIDELAAFYQVSKQAAKIRMIELGYPEAMEVYNYDFDCTLLSNDITLADAYAEYETNEDFKILFDMGLFRNVEGYFVIDTPDYRTESEDGGYTLTQYTRENLAESTLNFEYNIAELFEFNRANGVLYRDKLRREARTPQSIFAPKYNQAIIDKALEKVDALQKEIDALKAFFGETASQTIKRLMENQKPKWNRSIFSTKTGLNGGLFSKINTVRDKQLKLPVIVSICVGLGLPQEISNQIIKQAGIHLRSDNVEEVFYTRVISGVLPNDIHAINAVIDELNAKNPDAKIRPLGSQMYDGVSADEDEE